MDDDVLDLFGPSVPPEAASDFALLHAAYVSTSATIFIQRIRGEVERISEEGERRWGNKETLGIMRFKEPEVVAVARSDRRRLIINATIWTSAQLKRFPATGTQNEVITFDVTPLSPSTARDPRIHVFSSCSHPLAEQIYMELWETIRESFEDVAIQDQSRETSFNDDFDEQTMGFVETTAQNFVKAIRPISEQVRFEHAATSDAGKLFILAPAHVRGPTPDGSLTLTMSFTSQDQLASVRSEDSSIDELTAISIIARPLTPDSAQRLRTEVIATCRQRNAEAAFHDLIRQTKELFGILWQDRGSPPNTTPPSKSADYWGTSFLVLVRRDEKPRVVLVPSTARESQDLTWTPANRTVGRSSSISTSCTWPSRT